ncbi:hypothetical protein CDAR_20051 [Caerostris darwini]|uniref:Uncharacterized protein n=1 Tax=Caerostris darwini TaxID=1538125 RepID=A0AAV4SPS6_9ARAC|nr:hypothetical protein CDAR_20051 [Caerostris darwini]
MIIVCSYNCRVFCSFGAQGCAKDRGQLPLFSPNDLGEEKCDIKATSLNNLHNLLGYNDHHHTPMSSPVASSQEPSPLTRRILADSPPWSNEVPTASDGYLPKRDGVPLRINIISDPSHPIPARISEGTQPWWSAER